VYIKVRRIGSQRKVANSEEELEKVAQVSDTDQFKSTCSQRKTDVGGEEKRRPKGRNAA
jgi:hypothetical protein